MRAVKTFEEACKVLGYTTLTPTFDNSPEKHRKALVAHYKLIVIAEAINEGWQPNWANDDEMKFQLWPDIIKDDSKPSGFGLSYDGCDHWTSTTRVGSRLCFRSREAAKYCFDTFQSLWEDYFLIDKQ